VRSGNELYLNCPDNNARRREFAERALRGVSEIGRIQHAALTTALKELGRRHDGSKECTEAIKQVREALERVTG